MDREERYVVLKKSDIEKYLSDETRRDLEQIATCIWASRINDGKAPLECVVVESDWPMYDSTWQNIETWADEQSEPPPGQQ